MRRNTVTYWTTADFASRETCSFIRINDAFRETLLQAAKNKSFFFFIYCSFLGNFGTENIIKEKKWSSTEQASIETVAENSKLTLS